MKKIISKERALKNAFASAQMEGFRVTPEIERNCKRLLNGEINIDGCVKEMLANPSPQRTV